MQQFSEQVKYLSVLPLASLKVDTDIQRQMKSFYCTANKPRNNFSQCSTANISTVSCLVHANVRLPPMEHIHMVWY